MQEKFQQFSGHFANGSAKVMQGWQSVARQPSWVMRLALLTFVVVFVLPIVLLAVVAVVAAVCVFVVFAGARAFVQKGKNAFQGDGRKNVRVIERR